MKAVQYIDGDMPPLAETDKPDLLPPNQTVGAPMGSPGQIYGAEPADSIAAGTIPVAPQDVQQGETIQFTAWFGKAWVKWGIAGVLAGAAGRYGYQRWKGRR